MKRPYVKWWAVFLSLKRDFSVILHLLIIAVGAIEPTARWFSQFLCVVPRSLSEAARRKKASGNYQSLRDYGIASALGIGRIFRRRDTNTPNLKGTGGTGETGGTAKWHQELRYVPPVSPVPHVPLELVFSGSSSKNWPTPQRFCNNAT